MGRVGDSGDSRRDLEGVNRVVELLSSVSDKHTRGGWRGGMADDGERDVEKEEELKLAVRGGGGG